LTYFALEDAERIDRLVATSDGIASAYRIGNAVNKPELLEQENNAFLATLRRDPNYVEPPRPSREEMSRIAAEMFSKIKLKHAFKGT
jgi:hypothetical protein